MLFSLIITYAVDEFPVEKVPESVFGSYNWEIKVDQEPVLYITYIKHIYR